MPSCLVIETDWVGGADPRGEGAIHTVGNGNSAVAGASGTTAAGWRPADRPTRGFRQGGSTRLDDAAEHGAAARLTAEFSIHTLGRMIPICVVKMPIAARLAGNQGERVGRKVECVRAANFL
jgi:hypothetical protein